MNNIFNPGNNGDIENKLENLPDEIADALVKWRSATLKREKKEALLYLKYKNSDEKKTVSEIEALINSNEDRFSARLEEGLCEADYERLYERLMCAKKLADLRTAY